MFKLKIFFIFFFYFIMHCARSENEKHNDDGVTAVCSDPQCDRYCNTTIETSAYEETTRMRHKNRRLYIDAPRRTGAGCGLVVGRSVATPPYITNDKARLINVTANGQPAPTASQQLRLFIATHNFLLKSQTDALSFFVVQREFKNKKRLPLSRLFIIFYWNRRSFFQRVFWSTKPSR